MCTVTFWPKRRGYRLAMNRDESRTRPLGLPPQRHTLERREVLHPSEPTGGTWISVNDRGIGFALVNWYSVTARAAGKSLSRGDIILRLRTTENLAEADAMLRRHPLLRTNPFRLIGVFPAEETLREWRWNTVELETRDFAWKPVQWISSGLDEPGAQKSRSQVFREKCGLATAGTAEWLRRLHRSHAPEFGPYATCMHRPDAQTVSYTEIGVGPGVIDMRHCQGPPCSGQWTGKRVLPSKNRS
jgi:hypothetical protein